jgi:hypothetical protein
MATAAAAAVAAAVAAFCRKVFCVIVFPLACCETRLHFIPNKNSVFHFPSLLSIPTMLNSAPAVAAS